MTQVCSSLPIVILGLVLLALFGFVAIELLRRLALFAWICFLLIPIVMLPYWVSQNTGIDWFFWLKIYSMFLSCCWLLLLRYTSLKNHRWAFALIYAALMINMSEAIFRGFLTGYIPNILDACAGLLLLITIPPLRLVTISPEKNRDLLWDAPLAWMLGFTLWDTVFMYLTFPGSFGRTFASLVSPLLTALFFNRKLWIQGRAFVLAFFLEIAFTFPHAGDLLNMPCQKHPIWEWGLSIASCLWMAVYTFGHFRGKKA
jgi:hypothetical protein